MRPLFSKLRNLTPRIPPDPENPSSSPAATPGLPSQLVPNSSPAGTGARENGNLKALVATLRGVDAQCMVSFLLHDFKTCDNLIVINPLIDYLVMEANAMPCFYNPVALCAQSCNPRDLVDTISLCNETERVRIRIVHISTQKAAAVVKGHAKKFIKWTRLSHENIAPFHGAFIDKAQLCVVSPVVQGVYLGEYLRGQLSIIDQTFLALDVLCGLHYLHHEDIIHGNLRMETVFVGDNGRALLGDFGVVSVERACGVGITQLDGSARWNAPELINMDAKGNKVPPTQESDIWSFSCVCYMILTGRLPFENYEEDVDVVWALVANKQTPHHLAQDGRDVSVERWMWAIMDECWSHNPLSRPRCDSIHSRFLQHVPRRPGTSRVLGGVREWDSPVDYIHVWSILHQAPGGSLAAVANECFHHIATIGDEEWDRFAAGLDSDVAQDLADCLDLIVHDENEFHSAKLVLSRLTALSAVKAQAEVFPILHKLGGLEITLGGANPYVDQGEYLGHKLCARLVYDFNCTGDPGVWLKVHMKDLVAWAHLSHPNILPFYGLYPHSSGSQLIFPWITNGNLRDYLQRSPDAPRLLLASNILAGLQHLHEQGMVHTNLKATNVLVSDAGHALLADYGAPYIVGGDGATSSHTTYRWMAPELLQADEQVLWTQESDIWSFGCVCYEIFTGQFPFYHREQEIQVFATLINGGLPRRPDYGDGNENGIIPDEMWTMMNECWARAPSDRPPCEYLRYRYFPSEDDQVGSKLPVAFRDATRMSQGIDYQAKFQHVSQVLSNSKVLNTRSAAVETHALNLPDSRISACRRLFLDIKGHEVWQSFITALQGEDAQEMVDFLDKMLHDEGWTTSADDMGFLLSFFIDLASQAVVVPRCHELCTIDISEKTAATGGSPRIYKMEFLGQVLAIKAFQYYGHFRMTKANFFREAIVELATLAHLSHPNILPLYGAFCTENRIGLVFPWMDNGSLRAYMEHEKDIQESAGASLISGILSGLEYLHGKKIAHGGLKGDNILVSDDGHALIGDFALSRIMGAGRVSVDVKASDAIRWMAPELLVSEDESRPTLKSDMWSFGCVCGEVWTGETPFCRIGYQHAHVLNALSRGEVPWRQEELRPHNIPQSMLVMMMACWNRDPAKRPPSSEIRSEYFRSIDLGTTDPKTRDPKPISDQEVAKALRKDSERTWSVNYDRVLEILRKVRNIPEAEEGK